MFRYYCLFFTLALGLQSASDPWIGTWRLDKAKSHFENYDGPTSDAKLDITSEGNNYRLVFTVPGKDGKVQKIEITQPKEGGKIPGNMDELGVDATTLEVPDAHHWIYRYSKNGKLVFSRYVTLSADGKVHEAKATRMQDGKKVVEEEYMVKAN